MKTFGIRQHRHGGPEELVWEEYDLPDPGPGQVRLRHTAVGLNFIDVYQRVGMYPQTCRSSPAPKPRGCGSGGAGRERARGG